MSDPLVSVCCPTFNHERFIRDALDGFLMQEVDFSFEVLVNDDASTDGTPEILREYETRHPNLIKVVYQEENQYSAGGVDTLRDFLLPRSRARYIAVCEGDDYWTDPNKLQKQVDFLEAHPDHTLASSAYVERRGDETELVRYTPPQDAAVWANGFSFRLIDLADAWLAKTLTLVFRRDAYDPSLFGRYKLARDVHFLYHLLERGRGFYLHDVTGVYNVHNGGIHSGIDRDRRLRVAEAVYDELLAYNDHAFLRRKLLVKRAARIRRERAEDASAVSVACLIAKTVPLVRSWPDLRRLLVACLRT